MLKAPADVAVSCRHEPHPADYHHLLTAVKQRVREAQYRALQQVNQQQIQLYWDLGRLISERQQHGWGKSIVETLARDLQTEFVGMGGFSVQNLWYMRQFYLEYSADEFLQPLVGEISWAKHLLIMSKCKNPQARLFYTIQTRNNNWTKAVLEQQLKACAYENTVLAQQNFTATLPPRPTAGRHPGPERRVHLGLPGAHARAFRIRAGAGAARQRAPLPD